MGGASAPSVSRWTRPRRGRWRASQRGVSEVVATIILLALTVVLFSAIFAFVTTFPTPPTQSNNQFQASLTYTTSGTKTVVKTLNILHLAGPAVPSAALVYIKSAGNPSGAEFQTPYTMTQGGIASGQSWNLGQTWSYTFPAGEQPSTPDNFTIYLVSSTSVLFSVILPGQSFALPPTFLTSSYTPSSPTVGTALNVTVTLTGSVKTDSVYANFAGVPGFTTGSYQMKYNNATGQFYLISSVAGASTTAGTFYVFFNATGTNGLTAVGSLAVTIVNGASSSSSFSVSTFLVPSTSSAFPEGQESQGNLETVAALVTYNGDSTTTVSVNFYVNGTSGGRGFNAANYEWASSGTPVSITGPTSVTIYSNAVWTTPTNATVFAYTATALATGTNGVGRATGIYPFSPELGGVWGWNCGKTNGCTTGFYNHAASTCTNSTGGTGTCAIFYAKAWDNTTSSGTYSLNLYLNTTTTHRVDITSSGSIASGASVTATASTAWLPTKNTAYTLTLVVTVTTSIGSGTVTFSWGYYTTT